MSIFTTASTDYLEWEVPTREVPIRQGDLLVKHDGVAPRHNEACIVITADCDIARDKHQGAIAALRIISFADFVRHRWARTAYDSVLDRDFPELTNTFNQQRTQGESPEPEISQEALATWLERETPDQICQSIADIKCRDKAKIAAKKVSVLLGLDDQLTTNEPFDRVLEYMSIKDGIAHTDARIKLLKKARESLSTLPADIFFLNQFPIEKSSSHLILLRELIPIDPEIATASPNSARSKKGYLRLGRLKPAYKYALSQQFGLMFSRVGLPENYEVSKRKFLKEFEV